MTTTPWYKRFFIETSSILNMTLILLSIYIVYLLLPAIGAFLTYLFRMMIPFFLAFILYYLIRPIVQVLQKKISLNAAIGVAYLIIITFFILIVVFIYPTIVAQIDNFKTFSMDSLNLKNTTFFDFYNYRLKLPDELNSALSNLFANANTILMDSIVSFISTMTEFIFSFLISLIILFYLLKDDKKITGYISKNTPEEYNEDLQNLLSDMDISLMHFNNGRVVIALFTSILALIAFLIIGLNYAFVLAIISFIFFIIPTIGSILASILPVVVGFATNTFTGVEVLIIMIIVTSIEGFLISPEVMGKHLYIHPLTNIFLLLLAGAFYGIWGLLFITHAYVFFKIFTIHLYRFIEMKTIAHSKKEAKELKEA